MAAAVRALLRRRGAAPPPLALLQPLFPSRCSTPRPPLLATAVAAAAGLPVVRRPQLSPASAPPLLRVRYYSCQPPSSKGCEKPPQLQPLPRVELELEPEDVKFLMARGLLQDLEKHIGNLVEAVKICKKALALLDEAWNNKTVAMYENGLAKAFKALADCEKTLDDLSGALSTSNALSKDSLQRLQMFHQKCRDYNKFIRQELTNVQALFGPKKA